MIPATGCWRIFRSAGSTPRRSATACSPPPASWIERQGGPYVATNRTESGEVVVDETTAGATRRSVYLQQRRTQITSLLEVFDAPSIVTTCTRRLSSTMPLQSLSLLNAGFVTARAQSSPSGSNAIARTSQARLMPTPASHGPFCWPPAVRRTKTSTTRPGDSSKPNPSRYPGRAEPDARQQAWTDFCQTLFASNAFLYIE